MKYLPIILLVVLAAPAAADPVDSLLERYRSEGAGPFSAERGAAMWTERHPGPDGKARRCADCHGEDLTRGGRHLKTGKPIEPLAPSVNPERLTGERKTRKWLYRNCKWTLGRVCTAQEKGDFLTFLRNR